MRHGASRITDQLSLGGILDARDAHQLDRLGISRVLNVSESARFEDGGSIQFFHVPISDFGDTVLEPVFEKCLTLLSQWKAEGQKALVHCRHGQNRSPTVVLAYLIGCEGMSLRSAYDLVLDARPIVAVHEEYFVQLQNFEKKCCGEVTMTQADIGPSVQDFIRGLRAVKRD